MERAGIENLRIHDLRRSLGSWQAATGANLSIIGKTLAHKNELLQRDLDAPGKDLRHELKETESRIIFRLDGLMVVGISILAILVRIL